MCVLHHIPQHYSCLGTHAIFFNRPVTTSYQSKIHIIAKSCQSEGEISHAGVEIKKSQSELTWRSACTADPPTTLSPEAPHPSAVPIRPSLKFFVCVLPYDGLPFYPGCPCSQDKLQIRHDPDKNKVATEG